VEVGRELESELGSRRGDALPVLLSSSESMARVCHLDRPRASVRTHCSKTWRSIRRGASGWTTGLANGRAERGLPRL